MTSVFSGVQPIVSTTAKTDSPQAVIPNANKTQTITTATKPVVKPTPDGFHQVTVATTTPSGQKQTQTAVVTKAPTVVQNPDGTHTTTFHPSGGTVIATSTGSQSGYNSAQAKVGLVNPYFVTVYSALLSLPTVAQVNQALHSITAEPYASMQ